MARYYKFTNVYMRSNRKFDMISNYLKKNKNKNLYLPCTFKLTSEGDHKGV